MPESQTLSTQTEANRLNAVAAAISASAYSATPNENAGQNKPIVDAPPVTVNVITLGAKNDRSADASGVFNQAIKMAANGGTVLVPPGTYSLRGMIYLNQNGVTMLCQSGAKLIADAGLPDMIWINASNTLVEGCILDGNKAVNGSNGIGIDGSYTTVNGKTTITLASNNRVTGCTLQNVSGTNIYANAAQTLEIDHNTISSGGGDPIGVNDNLYNVSIHNNTITTAYALSGAGTHGIGVHSTPQINGPVQNIQIFANTIYQGAGNFCIEVLGLDGAQPIYNVNLHDNRCTFEGPGQGWVNGMDSLGQVQNGTVRHEILNANGIPVGIDFIELPGNTNNVTVDSNLMYNGSSSNQGGAIDVNGGSNNTISNNLLIGSGEIYIGGSGNDGTGVPCSNNVVKNNILLVAKNFGWSRGTVWIQENFPNNPATDNGHYVNNQIVNNYLVANNPSAIQIGIALENDYYSATQSDPAMIQGTIISGNHIYNNQYGLGQFSQQGSVSGTQSVNNVISPGPALYLAPDWERTPVASGDTQSAAAFDPTLVIPLLNASFFNSSMSAGLQQSMTVAMNKMPDAIT